MPYIKKLVMQGFKSFARKTEIPFENSMNVIVGPNGSGKSNITDALCFVLGRISIKSIRAAKAANLMFSGNKQYKASNEATVELIFDNKDMTFTIDSPEISIKRIVRKNGQSIYKINNETKTRQELLELLAQAGIDPNGFNIVLQGEIASLIKLSPEDRRKIIEEVAGISIYETRKEKSIRELEKTDEKLKEAGAVLREKNTYLRNLENERQEAINYQKIEETIKRCKATILKKSITEKEKEIWGIDKLKENQGREIEKIKSSIKEKEKEIQELEERVSRVNKSIQSSTSEEQEKLHREIADLKAELAGLVVRKENFETRLEQNKEKDIEIKQKIAVLEKELSEMKTSSPEIKKQQTQLKETQEKFDLMEKQRRQFYVIKSDISTLENKRDQKQKTIIEAKKELELIEKSISTMHSEIKYAKSPDKAVELKKETSSRIIETKNKVKTSESLILEIEKENAVLNQTITREEKLKNDIPKLEVCPLCLNTITESHVGHVIESADKKIKNSSERLSQNNKKKEELYAESEKLKEEAISLEQKLREIEIDIIKINNAEEKKNQIRRILESQKETENELTEINYKLNIIKKEFEKLKNIEERYDEARLKLQELSSSDIDVDTEITLKQRDLERIKIEIKSISRDSEESSHELKIIIEKIQEREKIASKKEKEEQELYEKFQKLFMERNEIQDQKKAVETTLIGMQHEIRSYEDKINNFNIQIAQHKAHLDTLKSDFREFETLEVFNQPISEVQDRLSKSQIKLAQIGSVNMRALEVYDKVKESCDLIQQKVTTIESEKEKIMKIIGEIDKKKRKSFLTTLDAVNESFTRNFSQLSKKGEVFLDLENKQEPFLGGLNIIVKVGKGKYFDITSLSGGEKTLIALSLIFAIQEYKPYCFYVFDEIDAALDKHNSELLAALIKKYMKVGQYIVVTHNDALISESTTLYGVSMQENISKVISLKV